MGIYDREYYRDETSGSGFLSGEAPACKAIISINVAVYLLNWFLGGTLMDTFAASSTAIFERFHVWQLLTYAFLHSDTNIFHILFNMLILWFLGREIEAMYGTREFTKMYLTAAVVAGFCWAVLNYFLVDGQGQMIGASGSVLAVVVLYALYYPKREILLFFILPVPIWLFAILFLSIDAFNLMRELRGEYVGNVAFAAHLGGAGYAFLYKRYDLRWSRILAMRKRRPRLRVVSPESPRHGHARPDTPSSGERAGLGRSASSNSFVDEHLDAKVDEILAKIARVGREGLTEEENRILQEASQRIRDRRG